MLEKKAYKMNNNLSMILGAKLLTITKVSNDTGLSRSTLTALYYKRAKRVQIDTLKKLCDYLHISLSELIEYEPETVATK